MKKFLKCAVSLLLVLAIAAAPVLTSTTWASAAGTGIEGSSLPQVYITVTDDACSGLELTKDIGYVSATIEIVDPASEKNHVLDEGSRIKVRGNSTAGGAKRPYNFKLSSKTNLLGMGKGKKWCLMANMFDKSLMRNKLVFGFAQSIGMDYVSDFRMVDVWMDGTYVGNYMLCEPVEANSTRVDINVDNGDYLFERERDRYEDGAVYLTTSRYGMRFVMADPEALTDAQYADMQARLDQVETAMDTDDYDTMAQYMDMESFINLYVIEEFFKDVDADFSSVKFYFKDGILYAGPVWDFDLACGNCSPDCYPEYNNVGGSGKSYEGFYASTAIWFRYLLKNEQFASAVKARFFELQPQIVNLYEDNELGQNQIDKTLAECNASFAANWTVWKQNSQDSGLERVPDATYAENVEYLRNWLKQRNAWMTYAFENDIPFINQYEVDYSNLPTGVYSIANSANTNFQLDVDCQSQNSGANVHIWSAHTANSQKWIFWAKGNGYYAIENLNSHKYLDIYGAGTADGTNIWQYNYNGSNAQLWRVVNNGDGTCTLVSACGNKVLDMSGGGQPANGTNIHVWSNNGTTAQKWVLKPQAVLQDGVYTIGNSANSNYLLDVSDKSTANSANVAVWQAQNANHQKFAIQADSNGYYTIRAVHSGKVLDATSGGKTNGTNIIQYEENGGNNQKWLAVPYNGSYIFVSKCNGLVLDMSGGGQPANGTNIQCWTLNWSTAQLWNLAPATIGMSGVYSISASGDTNYVLDIEGVSNSQGANLHLWQNCDGKNQKFVLQAFEDGYYGIRALHSGLYLNVNNWGTANGTNVIQWGAASKPEDNEKWSLIPNTDGTYSLVAKCNGMYLDLSGNTLANGTNVQLWSHDPNTAAQKWVLSDVLATVAEGTYSLCSAANTKYCLDIDAGGSNAQVWTNANSANQKFTLSYVGDGYYTITATHSGKVLDVAGGVAGCGTNVQQYASNGSDAQLWRVLPNRDGSYTFVSKLGDFCLDMNGGNAGNGVNVSIWSINGTAAQGWFLK